MLLLDICFSLMWCWINNFDLFTMRETFCITPCTMKKTLLTTPVEGIPVWISAISKTGCGWFTWRSNSSHPFFSVQNGQLTCRSSPLKKTKPSGRPWLFPWSTYCATSDSAQLCSFPGLASGFTGLLFSKYTWAVPRMSQTAAVTCALGGAS